MRAGEYSRFAALWLAVLGGCSGDTERSGPASTMRDSAGIRILENFAPTLPAESAWTIASEPTLRIGTADGTSEQLLHRVAAALRLSDGRIVIANSPPPMVRWFSRDGRFLHGTGRPGGGPGEFGGGESAWIYTMWRLPGDSVATWEHSARRMQVFDPEGRYARAVVLELPPDMHPLSYPQITGRFAGGFLAFLSPHFEPGPLGAVRRDSLEYVRYGGAGEYLGRIARLPGFERYTAEIERPGRGTSFLGESGRPFGKPPLAFTDGQRFYYGSADRYEIEVRDPSGALRMLIRRPDAGRALTPDILDRYIADRRAATPSDPAQQRALERYLDNAPFPDSLPAYRRFRVDTEGMLWVQEYDLPWDTVATWNVFDTGGRWLTNVDIPKRLSILDIGADYILGVTRDELDVERVDVHALRRRITP